MNNNHIILVFNNILIKVVNFYAHCTKVAFFWEWRVSICCKRPNTISYGKLI